MAVKAMQAVGMDAYADIVLDHRLGADETEQVEIDEISGDDRNQVIGGSYNIQAWSEFNFPGRHDTYSSFKWHWRHFVAFGSNASAKDDSPRIYRVKRKTFSGEVSFEHGNFDYLMGADVDQYDPEVPEELLKWGKWYSKTTGINGFRLDAVKHIPASILKQWIQEVRADASGREIFAVGEYWSGDAQGNYKLTSHRTLIDYFMRARTQYAYGELHDYFDHRQCVGWTWTGDTEHEGSLAVLMRIGDAGSKRMKTHRKYVTYHDITRHRREAVTTDRHGEAEFRCNGGSVSVWCA